MFTGIVEELGTVVSVHENGRYRFACSPALLEDATLGASIAHNGCCLTVVAMDPAADPPWYDVDAVPETLARTNLGDLAVGDPVNLERPVRLQDRLGGHLVLGHVDAAGTVLEPAPDLKVSLPHELARYVVEKGSITVDGCSLTVVAVDDGRPATPTEPAADGWFSIAIIPHTAEVTTLGRRRPGDRVNLEVDVMAKHAAKLLGGYLPAGSVG